MVYDILLILLLWIVVALVHEFGHWIVGRQIDRDAKIVFKLYPFELYTDVNDTLYNSAPKDNKQIFFIAGIFMGLVPLFFYATFYNFLGVMFIMIYLLPIRSDIKELIKLNGEKD
jgi:hypothetical protein